MINEEISYCCPHIDCKHSHLIVNGDGFLCPDGHFFAFVDGTTIPDFAGEQVCENEYTHANAAEIHDNAFKWLFASFGSDESILRRNLVSRLRLDKGQKVLITGVGAGNDLPYISEGLQGTGIVFAQDISKQMLLSGVERTKADARLSGLKIHYSVSDATNLPFGDDVFDAAYHFGGINLFPSISKGISEMNRVVKPGGRVVIGDEGIAPWLKNKEYGKMIINNNALCSYDAPISYLPDTAREVNLSWELGYYFYVIDYTVSSSPLYLDIDVPHVGKRGGSIRTRYYGQLEGIDPALKHKVYSEAERNGVSRVEYLESLLKKSLNI